MYGLENRALSRLRLQHYSASFAPSRLVVQGPPADAEAVGTGDGESEGEAEMTGPGGGIKTEYFDIFGMFDVGAIQWIISFWGGENSTSTLDHGESIRKTYSRPRPTEGGRMKIEIKLYNPKYCDRCPLMFPTLAAFGNNYCRMGYFERTPTKEKNPRPDRCIEENGE